MQQSTSIIRFIFVLLCLGLVTSYAFTLEIALNPVLLLVGGIGVSLVLTAFAFFIESWLKPKAIISIGSSLIGLSLGYLLALTLISTFSFPALPIPSALSGFLKILTLLGCSYVGMFFTNSWSWTGKETSPNESEKTVAQNVKETRKKDLILDTSILFDARLIDLASSGLVDRRLMLPQFVISEINLLDHGDEHARIKSKRAHELLKKLESMPTLELEISNLDYNDIKDPIQKLIKLARDQGSHILTADLNRILQPQADDVRWININFLSNALKPLTQTGENISIKIQRYGKEPRQGVGYLEDGTMVVVNSGAEFIGETIQAQVLSVKHTSSGRMIFCNAMEELSDVNGNNPENYFALDMEKRKVSETY